VVTHFLVVSDQDRSRDFYRSVFGATVVLAREPVIMKAPLQVRAGFQSMLAHGSGVGSPATTSAHQ
jgi:catechol 2,3-dioxygenase-like lactoylglutathione lyase family enzyme